MLEEEKKKRERDGTKTKETREKKITRNRGTRSGFVTMHKHRTMTKQKHDLKNEGKNTIE